MEVSPPFWIPAPTSGFTNLMNKTQLSLPLYMQHLLQPQLSQWSSAGLTLVWQWLSCTGTSKLRTALWMLLTFSLLFIMSFKSCKGLFESCRAALSPARAHPTLLHVVISNWMQKFPSAFAELQEVSISPFFQGQGCSAATLPYRMSVTLSPAPPLYTQFGIIPKTRWGCILSHHLVLY